MPIGTRISIYNSWILQISVLSTRIRSMESNINLESIRELSGSQLDALLRCDSPHETPLEPTEPLLFNIKSLQKDLREINNYGGDSLELNSQIDFSFSQRSSNLNWLFSPVNLQINVADNSICKSSSLDTVEIPNIQEQINDHTSATSVCNLNEKSVELTAIDTNCLLRIEDHTFDEVDKIFDKIEYMSNLPICQLRGQEGSHYIYKEYQTQFQLDSDLNKSFEKNTFSSLPCSSTPSNVLHKNNSTNSFSQEGCAKTYNDLKYDCLQHKLSTPKCISLDKTVADDLEDVGGNFEKPRLEHVLSYSGSNQRPPQVQIKSNREYVIHGYGSQNNVQSNATPKYSENINMLVDASSIPFSVKQLYDVVKSNYSDFAFIYALSSQLCQDRVPMECFVTLKMGLLLSLVSIGNNDYRPPIPIVALTNDTYITNYLMSSIGQLGSRFLGPVDDMKSFSNANCIEADSVLLARGGVYYVAEWSRIKLRRAETIFKIIECSSVPVEKSTMSFPLETAIWTHWRSFKYCAKDQQIFNKFLKYVDRIFGIPIFVSDDSHEALIDYTLEQSSVRVFESTIDHLSINKDDMRNFLVYISQNNVEISPEAALLLKNYFVATRSFRKDCLSKQSYIVLKQFAESFAKLSMRKVVLFDDAVAAIILCEHFIENIFGANEHSSPHFGNFTFVGEVDKYLTQFKKWLNSYIVNFANE